MSLTPTLALLAVLAAPGDSVEEPGLEFERFVLKQGDDPSFAAPDFDDADWVEFERLPNEHMVFWLRLTMELPEDAVTPGEALAVSVSILASFELYWDGRLLGTSGVVGTDRASETPGAIREILAIPDELCGPGRHVLALRGSNHHYHLGFSTWFYGIWIAPLERLVRGPLLGGLIPLLVLGALLLTSIHFLLRYLFEGRAASSLLFGLLCLAVSLLLVAESWREMFGYTYDRHVVRIHLIAGITFVVAWLLPVFMAVWLGIGRGLVAVGTPVLLGVAFVVPPGFDFKSALMLAVAHVAALAVAVVALRRRRVGALAAIVGLTVGVGVFALDPWRYPDTGFFLTFPGLVVCLLVPLVRGHGEAERRRKDVELRAARLEIELLRRHLAPHFLMNSLTTVLERVEEDPDEASRLVEALADEARLLARVASETLVPLGTELDLCRSHLRIMSLRRERPYRLEVDGVDERGEVPPALFHTLIENGITHGGTDPGERVFLLREERVDGGRRYVLTAPGASAPQEADGAEGTGLRYVRARLEESFPGRWALASGPNGDDWKTVVELRA